MKGFLRTLCITVLLATAAPACAAIRYGSTTYEAPFAATTTDEVGRVLTDIATGKLGASSTSDVPGIINGLGRVFSDVSAWFNAKAGIDLIGISTGIGDFFGTIGGWLAGFVRDLL